jgi:hypothetical protein
MLISLCLVGGVVLLNVACDVLGYMLYGSEEEKAIRVLRWNLAQRTAKRK